MPCKYEGQPFPPCHFEQHPRNSNIYFCPHCREWYDVRDVASQSPNWLLLIIAVSLLIFASNNSTFSQPSEDNPPSSSSSQLK